MLPLCYGSERALSPKEYVSSSRAGNSSCARVTLHCARQLQRRYIMDIVIAQMIVTGVLLFGFSVEVLLGHFNGSK